MTIAICTLASRFMRSLLTRLSSSLRPCSSSLTVLSSSLVLWSSSFAVSSSSLVLCSSSLADRISSLADFSSSLAASCSSMMDWRYSRLLCSSCWSCCKDSYSGGVLRARPQLGLSSLLGVALLMEEDQVVRLGGRGQWQDL